MCQGLTSRLRSWGGVDNKFFGFYGSLDGYPGSCHFSTLPGKFARCEESLGNKCNARLQCDSLSEEEVKGLSFEVIIYKWEGVRNGRL